MRPDDLLKMLRQHPFKPFRIFLSDGSEYEIRHPELAMVFYSTVHLGVPGPQGIDGPLENYVECALSHITRIEPKESQSVAP